MKTGSFPERQETSKFSTKRLNHLTLTSTPSELPHNFSEADSFFAAEPTLLAVAHEALSAKLHREEQNKLLRQQAIAAAQTGDYSSAVDILNLLIARNPESATDYNNRGLIHFQNGAYSQAIADYNRAIQLNPSLASVYNNRANYYAAQGQLAEAIADYDQAIDLDPSNIRAWINQGITFRDLEMYEQAIANFDIALYLGHLTEHVHAERGRAYHLAGDWNCAIADYHQALAQLAQIDIAPVATRLQLQVQTWLDELLGPLQLKNI